MGESKSAGFSHVDSRQGIEWSASVVQQDIAQILT